MDRGALIPYTAARAAATVLAVLLAMLGAFVALGWMLESAAMVRIVPNSVAMGLNTALAFVVAGVWLLSQHRQSAAWKSVRTSLAFLLVAVFSLVLIEHVFDVGLGIDWEHLHQKIQDQNPRPGRVAPNTSLALVLTGLAFLLIERAPSLRNASRIAKLLVTAVLAIGIFGLLGYALKLEALYQWYRLNSMAVATAVGICVMAVALLLWLHEPESATQQLANIDKKIVSRSTAILAMLAGAFALAGFILLRDGVDSVMRHNLFQSAENNRELLLTGFEQHVRMAQTVANRPGMLNSIATLLEDPNRQDALKNVRTVQKSFLALGFSRLDIYTRFGHLLTPTAANGAPALSVRLHSFPLYSELLWKNGYVLRNKIDLTRQGELIGYAIAEQPLTTLTYRLVNVRGAGKTGEYRLCARAADLLRCFPSRLDRTVRDFPFLKQRKPSFPVARAILGEQGVVLFTDYRHRGVLAAYVTVESENLGLVMKQDVEELYTPLRNRLALLVGLIGLLVVASGYILRSTIKPLTSQLLRAETAARENAEALRRSMAALNDTSEQLRASESEIRKLNSELEERVKIRTADLVRANEDLNQFAYAASHDLQEPLRNVSLYSQLMTKNYRGKLDAEANGYLDFISQSAQRMQQLLRDVLDYTQVATGKSEPLREPTSSEQALAEALANLHVAIKDSHAQITHGILPGVYVYRAHLVQLLQNLIANAIKYRSDRVPQIHIDARKQGDKWLFCVRDNGIGIERQYLEKIFGVFKRLHKESHPGTGIGLAICQKIVHRYQGKIWAESQFGKGTTIYFSLPAAPIS